VAGAQLSEGVVVIVSFHLVRMASAGGSMLRQPLDRVALRRSPGLVFGRLLGTGAGSSTSVGADLRRWAFLARWRDEAALDAFVGDSPWVGRGTEAWHVALDPIDGHGTWGGATLTPEHPAEPGAAHAGPIAHLTRAEVRWRAWHRFGRAQPAVDRQLHASEGLLAVVGVGEVPVGRQATFSVWRCADDARAFAYEPGAHRDVVARTRAEGWYGEELFGRFRPRWSLGSWDGRDPLAGLLPSR
jgi:hypothetical protein